MNPLNLIITYKALEYKIFLAQCLNLPSDRATCRCLNRYRALSGPFLVSRTGDVGWSKRWFKVPKYTLIDPTKGVDWYRQ